METDGGFVWRRIDSAIDNLDGTITITLNEALPDNPEQSTILRTSILERVRFAQDEFVLNVQHRDVMFLDVTMRTVYDEEDELTEEEEEGLESEETDTGGFGGTGESGDGTTGEVTLGLGLGGGG